MNIHEFQSKEVFALYGIPVPRGIVATTPAEAKTATQELGGQSVVKAQIHAGGRGKSGGVQLVHSPGEAEEAAQRMLASNIVTAQTGPDGAPVEKLLIEELADIKQELYVALTIDRGHRGPAILVSTKGGMDIEEVAANNPEDIHTEPVDPLSGLMPFQTRRLVRQLGLGPAVAGDAAKVLSALYRVFVENDCTLVEINPLIITGDDRVVALDAKINLDDDSMFRHADLMAYRDINQEDPLEAQASDLNIAYVNLDGDVGCLVNGAGLAMATLDVTNAAGAAPANFLDVGGGATPEKVANAVKIILSDPNVKRVLVNIFGGILRCDIAGEGIVLAYKETGSTVPLVVRMLGTNVVEGKEILGTSGLPVVFAETLTDAADAIKQLKV
ncbi:MAG: ADP-forming succinate--CoA ligase subunit beta [Dehalococcoidia bacterium]|uniref:Succinyl-CoA ligase [ADP-forming] beta chain n=1 Tax=hydrothermal vent metagenome TaxID=652676 RepID=A0A160V7X7_9ZZZZ|nr:ADP-forming succinate--CoA ligase subunit beta [Dehalococcoidia bacterium]